jgi:cyclophilin family peptidyl-prolyl cis-trans isomerase
VGTDKRERKKMNRQIGRQMQQQAERRRKTLKTTFRVTGAIVVLVAAFVLIAVLTNDGSNDASPTDSIPTDSIATDSLAPSETTAPASTVPAEFQYGTGECAPTDGSADQTQTFDDSFQLCIDPTKTYTAVVTTNFGEYTIELDAAKAPGTVNNFVNLARFKYFDDTVCHRAIPGFMVQCGDPTATGSGGPGYSFLDELPEAGEYEIGSIAMANAGPNTNGSQFFVITGDQGVSLPPSYTLFGKVIDGLDTTVAALDEVGNPADNGVPPLEEIQIISIVITES